MGAIQEIRPDKAYLAGKGRYGDEDMRQFVTNGDFTGDIIIFDPFDNVPLRGRRFKDGLVTGNLKYKSPALMVDDPIDPPKPKKKTAGLDDDDPAFGPSNKYNITFYDRDAWPANYPKFNELAAGSTYHRFVNGILKVDVYLNNPLLECASQEYIAATLLHEIAHGILTYENIDGSNAQHNEMFKKYRKEIAAGLREMFPGINKDDADVLAYEGLDGTIWGSAFKTAFPKSCNTMVVIMDAYRNGNKGTKCSK
ncbi:SprT-like domain-containing protein [Chitinophaga polysaccharea]|uniref:SprT-like domain-containing protein n=1 Tax=Chitinophaga polysaccharea TaxID=1293035 RepID=UPI00115BB08E|nr:SprT-like domain-containing protein [Chitinophaga polysaccharea]